VYVVGAANSAGQAAMYFSAFANSVTMLVRRDSLSSTMSKYLMDQIEETENIRVWTNSKIQEAQGTERLERLVISREGGGKTETFDAHA
jgi:thioredoxin reductase (NADPH)